MSRIRIHVDQRTLALYGVSHAAFEKGMRDELSFAESMGCEIDVVPDAGNTDQVQFQEAWTTISADEVAPSDFEALMRGIRRAWERMPKTFSQGGVQYRILPAAGGNCAVIDEARPEAPMFTGAWYFVVRFLRLNFSRFASQEDSR
ncbi:hypothetical protein [Burkholderia thailandensis]|uniref:Uncharacterized protein n=2 Tax=Burkholderia thailandensis TaxID=57975 RepID=A0AAW9CNG8_BURTH|nr:hypothetical protein [Burkholderia thailandensis]AHI68426.1 hypothetical protein BTL_5542 [Burkholderia thailandensis H0587]AIP64990.1 hypothetical protein DR62_5342 [Burkholderia thailandensis]AJY33077.1 hypothetical protein BTM_4033 [Burkholderia thailandensis 34]AOI54076.1 hypothetical protein WI24_19500 [Burkholderia thailandensis]AOJ53062.1 hypothetical protein AQ475_19320 [Burkholderia thailandensis]